MSNKKFQVVIEYAWIVMAVFCFVIAIIYHIKIGFDQVWLIYLLGFLSLCFFFIRRMQRKNKERRGNNRFR